jgi:hypothetical protein
MAGVKKPVETYDDAEAFRRAAAGKKPRHAKRGSELPRAPAGIGDKHAALMRLAVYGISMRFDAGLGFSGWNARTGQRYPAHEDYAAAIKAAEEEAKR